MYKAGDQIGPYTLIKQLGNGAFGVVWLAERRTAIAATKVAIKIAMEEEPDLDAIRQEANVWAEIGGHPNVLPMIEADIFDNQILIVSEYTPDGSLEGWMKKNGGKAPSIESAVAMTQGILSGLEHLHSKKILHRDLKPANILLQGETPRLADFGLSRILKSTSQSTNASGTPAYMSPEAFDGKKVVQTDLWAVGIILYQLLTGQFPFSAKEYSALVGAILLKDSTPLPEDLKQFESIISKALQKNPENRYRSAAEMKAALQGSLAGVIEQFTASGVPTKKISEGALQTLPQPIHQVETGRINNSSTEIETIQRVKVQTQPQVQVLEERRSLRNKSIFVGIIVAIIAVVIILSTVINTGENSVDKPVQQAQEAAIDPAINMKFMKIPAGEFIMGSDNGNDDEKPVHNVQITKDFELGKYEVTQAQWKSIMGSNPSYFRGDDLPVETVTWEDVQKFIEVLNSRSERYNYRLPAEAEWEYACRAGTTSDYAGDLDTMAWYKANSEETIHPVGQKQANGWGLHDMHGNVWEWCQDWYGEKYYASSPSVDPRGSEAGSSRVVRGGCWLFSDAFCRSAGRYSYVSGNRTSILGFRLVRTPLFQN
jgi:formylglycine-generating enzyme required for sulfatase activity